MPAAAAIAVVAAGAYSANRQASAAKDASKAQSKSADAGIAEQRRQFDAIQKLLDPFVNAGTAALGEQGNLAGINGTQGQKTAIRAIEGSPMFQAALQAGEEAILSNASATGGLRGGNVQGALAQFRPDLLAQAVNDQYARLGGLSSMGLGAAGQTGQFAQSATNNVANLLQQRGAAQAGGALAQGQAQAGYANAISSGIGMYAGMGGKF